MIRQLTAVLPMILAIAAAGAETDQRGVHAGDSYEIVRLTDTSQNTGDGSSGSSHDRSTLIEHVIAVREGGLELEYDLPKAASAADRARTWQFPARVLKPAAGQMKLLNGPELEARVDGWLKSAGLPRSACGRLIFTWNAFRIECDPQSVIQMLAPFDLWPGDLGNGAMYQDARAVAPAPMSQKTAAANGSAFVADMVIDPSIVRRERAQTDIAVAEMTQKSLTLDAALRARAAEQISGTISASFDTDSAGHVLRKTRTTKLEIKRADGKLETQTIRETVERKLVQD